MTCGVVPRVMVVRCNRLPNGVPGNSHVRNVHPGGAGQRKLCGYFSKEWNHGYFRSVA